jgi:hypothetical protein
MLASITPTTGHRPKERGTVHLVSTQVPHELHSTPSPSLLTDLVARFNANAPLVLPPSPVVKTSVPLFSPNHRSLRAVAPGISNAARFMGQ